MGLATKTVTALGLIFLTHAIYSAHEHTALHSTTSPSSSASSAAPIASSLPLDIILELLIAVLLTSVGVVLGSAPLRPIQWNKWAGHIEKSARKENPYRGLEERLGFWDVREKRKDFADWVRTGGK